MRTRRFRIVVISLCLAGSISVPFTVPLTSRVCSSWKVQVAKQMTQLGVCERAFPHDKVSVLGSELRARMVLETVQTKGAYQRVVCGSSERGT